LSTIRLKLLSCKLKKSKSGESLARLWLKLLSCKLKKSKSGESLARLWDLPELEWHVIRCYAVQAGLLEVNVALMTLAEEQMSQWKGNLPRLPIVGPYKQDLNEP
ncbi:hypothetical protein Tco_1357460, partial [Tanacetum coccineum]